MKEYLALLGDILANGARREDRTGTGALSVFGRQTRLDLARGFPLLTTKKIHIKSVVCEMLWFLRGDTNINYLRERGVTIWDEWADDDGEVGPLYGAQWRRWKTPDGERDQIAAAIRDIKTRPHSRRIVVSALNIADFPDENLSPRENAARGKMALAPCHAFFQFYADRGRLSCLFYCRSQDVFLGTPFNWGGYALLVHLVAQQCDLAPGDLIWTGGDCHLYLNHLNQAREQLTRPPYPLPRLIIRRRPRTVFDYEPEDFAFENYRHHPPIKAPIAV